MTFSEILINSIPIFVGFIVGTLFGMALLGMSEDRSKNEFIKENLADLDFLAWCFENKADEMQELVRCYNESDENVGGDGSE